jgi:hypothetical protein
MEQTNLNHVVLGQKLVIGRKAATRQSPHLLKSRLQRSISCTVKQGDSLTFPKFIQIADLHVELAEVSKSLTPGKN